MSQKTDTINAIIKKLDHELTIPQIIKVNSFIDGIASTNKNKGGHLQESKNIK